VSAATAAARVAGGPAPLARRRRDGTAATAATEIATGHVPLARLNVAKVLAFGRNFVAVVAGGRPPPIQ
jgi:hypothetical protein